MRIWLGTDKATVPMVKPVQCIRPPHRNICPNRINKMSSKNKAAAPVGHSHIHILTASTQLSASCHGTRRHTRNQYQHKSAHERTNKTVQPTNNTPRHTRTMLPATYTPTDPQQVQAFAFERLRTTRSAFYRQIAIILERRYLALGMNYHKTSL